MPAAAGGRGNNGGGDKTDDDRPSLAIFNFCSAALITMVCVARSLAGWRGIKCVSREDDDDDATFSDATNHQRLDSDRRSFRHGRIDSL